LADDVTNLHIPLRREWDYSRHFDDDKDNSYCHVIRKKEQEMLVDFLQRKNEGALLLSGKRGVGKTSAKTMMEY
jgi:ATP-dependent Clp protease ATP-binding subunit ClpA